MKEGIHPEYVEANVTCGCGNKFLTRSTKKNITVEICSACHPFFTGKMKYVDATGQVDKFQRKYNWDSARRVARPPRPRLPSHRSSPGPFARGILVVAQASCLWASGGWIELQSPTSESPQARRLCHRLKSLSRMGLSTPHLRVGLARSQPCVPPSRRRSISGWVVLRFADPIPEAFSHVARL